MPLEDAEDFLRFLIARGEALFPARAMIGVSDDLRMHVDGGIAAGFVRRSRGREGNGCRTGSGRLIEDGGEIPVQRLN